jgi:uncharacterized damage-inducible protein DinB
LIGRETAVDGVRFPPTIRAMAHPLVDQLRFTRSEWLRALDGIPDADGMVRVGPMNSISWIVFHLAWHEQRSFLTQLQGLTPVPAANEHGVNGQPASTPPLADALRAWHDDATAADQALDGRESPALARWQPNTLKPQSRLVGSILQRVIYHYWFHTGEITAIRQVLGHAGVPEFVGDIDGLAPYRGDGSA